MSTRSFAKAAHTYDQYANIQKRSGSELQRFISKVPNTVLDVGCGTGRLAYTLAERFPNSQIIAIDPESEMIAYAKSTHSAPNIRYIIGTLDTLPSDISCIDLIISNAVLHWIPEPKKWIAHCKERLSNNGQCIVSSYGPHTFHECQNALIDADINVTLPCHAFPDGTTLNTIIQPYFSTTLITRTRYCSIYPSLTSFLQTLKKTGTQGASSLMWTQTMHHRLNDAYTKRYKHIQATSDIYFISAKP